MTANTTARRSVRGVCALFAPALLFPSQTGAGTVAYWRFEPGDFLADSAGSNTLANAGVTSSADVAPFAPGSGSASFNGNQTQFSTAAPLNLSAFQDLTIECFFKTSQQSLAVLFEHAPANTNAPGSLGGAINDLANELEVYQRGSSGTYLDETTLPVTNDVWHHLAMTLDGSATGVDRLHLFLDGAEVGVDNNFSPSGTPASLNEVFYIGSRLNSQLKYAGLLDELRISDQILSPTEFLPEPSLALAAGAMAVLPFRRHLRPRRGRSS